MESITVAYIPSSHLDLYWLGNYKTCLERGAQLIHSYLDRCLETLDETFLLETVVFADHFLKKYPEYCAKLIQLVHEGRVEIGSAYVDRWETVIPGESLIRNILLGKRWCRDVLGIDNTLVTHPDLPSLTPQIPQIYQQLGLKYYVTSRKVFPHGQIWRYRAPDGSLLIMLNWPRHYVFVPMDASDVSPKVLKRMWVSPLNLDETLKGFPLGTVTISGSGGDLTDRESFRERYGMYLEEFVTLYRSKYPRIKFTYTIPSAVLSAYDNISDLPERSGEAPKLWGVGGGEDHRFFVRNREIESRLLTAESLVAIANRIDIPWRPPTADNWQGTFHEDAFFARKDIITPGKELDELWRMHIFTQDHNAGGQEGELSSFQRRTMQDRCLAYSQEIIDFTLDQIASGLPHKERCLVVFNPHGQAWSGYLLMSLPDTQWENNNQLVDEEGSTIFIQVLGRRKGQVEILAYFHNLPALGYRTYTIKHGKPTELTSAIQVSRGPDALHLVSPMMEVTIDTQSGSLTRIYDRQRNQEWGSLKAGQLTSIEECGNDVSMRISPDAAVSQATLIEVNMYDANPAYTRARIRKEFLNCEVEQTITLWCKEPRLDLETRIFWWGKRFQQVCLGLLRSTARADITHGSVFYGTGWNETLEGCGPWNADEVSPEIQMSYRESIGWLHVCGGTGGLTIVSHHPWYHHTLEGLEAVLMRTSPSCGDGRLFLEQAGEHTFAFSYYPGDQDWKKANPQQLASSRLKPPVYHFVKGGGKGVLPSAHSFLTIENEQFALSCLYPGPSANTTIARIWETTGHPGKVRFSGPLSEHLALAVDFMGEGGQPLDGKPGFWEFDVPAWGIRTVLFT